MHIHTPPDLLLSVKLQGPCRTATCCESWAGGPLMLAAGATSAVGTAAWHLWWHQQRQCLADLRCACAAASTPLLAGCLCCMRASWTADAGSLFVLSRPDPCLRSSLNCWLGLEEPSTKLLVG